MLTNKKKDAQDHGALVQATPAPSPPRKVTKKRTFKQMVEELKETKTEEDVLHASSQSSSSSSSVPTRKTKPLPPILYSAQHKDALAFVTKRIATGQVTIVTLPDPPPASAEPPTGTTKTGDEDAEDAEDGEEEPRQQPVDEATVEATEPEANAEDAFDWRGECT